MAGVGDAGKLGENFMIVNSGRNLHHSIYSVCFLFCVTETPVTLIEAFLQRMMARPDIAMIFVATDVADRIRPMMHRYSRSLVPNLLEIPTKLHPYNPDTDPVVKLAKVKTMFYRIINCWDLF